MNCSKLTAPFARVVTKRSVDPVAVELAATASGSAKRDTPKAGVMGRVGLTLILITAGTSSTGAEGRGDEAKRFARGSNAFGIELYRRVRVRSANWAFSPASVTMTLALAWPGARGETAAEIERVLRLGGAPDGVMGALRQISTSLESDAPAFTFQMASGLFGEQSLQFEPRFVQTMEIADARLEAVDFRTTPDAARVHINKWVEERTRNRVRDLVPEGRVDASTRLVLVSALYFKGEWGEPFDLDATKPAPFHVTKTVKKMAPTMQQTVGLRFASRKGLRALELPYVEERLSMLILLPDRLDGLAQLEDSLTVDEIDRIVGDLSTHRVTVSMPKFRTELAESLVLGSTLRGMGMSAAFDPARADFTGMASSLDQADNVFIDEVLHQAFVEADEEGTEASATTGTLISLGVAPSLKTARFRADHPFLFLIRDVESGLVLFLGRVADPSDR